MINKKPIIFFGTEDFSAISLQALIDANFNIAGIITKPDSKKGRGQKIQSPKVKTIGIQNNIPVLQPLKMSETVDFINSFKEKPAGVLVSFGRIIPQSIIELFSPGIINVHPSLLPKYRGPCPIESAILNGDSKTGVSLMKLAKEMDAGDVYIQEEINLNGNETSKDLYDVCGKIGARMLIEHLPAILEERMIGDPQIENKATYCQLLSKDQSLINPTDMTAVQAERQVRAFYSFPKSKIKINDYLIIINSAKVVSDNKENNPLIVKFNDGNFLKIENLTTPNGKKTTSKAFINGYLSK